VFLSAASASEPAFTASRPATSLATRRVAAWLTLRRLTAAIAVRIVGAAASARVVSWRRAPEARLPWALTARTLWTAMSILALIRTIAIHLTTAAALLTNREVRLLPLGSLAFWPRQRRAYQSTMHGTIVFAL
jgi:hypothetical protein